MNVIVEGNKNGTVYKHESEVEAWAAVSMAKLRPDGAVSIHTLSLDFGDQGKPQMALQLTTADAFKLREDIDNFITFAHSQGTDEDSFLMGHNLDDAELAEVQSAVGARGPEFNRVIVDEISNADVQGCEECETSWIVSRMNDGEVHRTSCSKYIK